MRDNSIEPFTPRDARPLHSNPYASNKRKSTNQQQQPETIQEATETSHPQDKKSSQGPLHDDSASSSEAIGGSSNENAIASQNSMRLLSMLQRDYEELEKDSVKACLRSKQFPCPEVSKVLQEGSNPSLDFSVLQESCQILMDHPDYLAGCCGGGNTNNIEQEEKQKSSLWYMTRLGTIVRFLQLLLVTDKNKLSPQQTNPLLLNLMKALVTNVEKSLQYWTAAEKEQQQSIDDDRREDCLYNGPVSQTYHGPQVACFVLAFCLRIKSVMVQHRLDLLPALWKSVDAIFTALAMTTSSSLPVELLQDAIDALGGYLKDFLWQAVGVLALSKQSALLQPHQVKISSFFLTKLSRFLKLHANQEGEKIPDDILSLLVSFCGLAVYVAATQPDQAALLQTVQKVSSKAEKCLLSVLLTEEEKGAPVVPKAVSLHQLCNMRQLTRGVLGQSTTTTQSSSLLQSSFDIGKWHILQEVLQQCLNSATTPSDGSLPLLWTEEAHVNSLLAVCENLVFGSLPMCHTFLTTARLKKNKKNKTEDCVPTKLLETTLRSISQYVYACETTAPCMTANALHCLLLRWLMPMASQQQHHPLTRECVLFLVQTHVTRLGSNHNGTPLMTLLTKALFDHRTSHKSTIAALIRKMLVADPNGGELPLGLQRLVCAEYGSKPLFRSRKRRRDGKQIARTEDGNGNPSWHPFSVEDIRVIATVMARVPFSVIPNAKADLEHFCLNICAKKKKKKRRKVPSSSLAKRSIIALSLLEAAVREDPSLVFLKSICPETGTSSIQQRLCTWFLSQVDSCYPSGRQHVAEQTMESLAIIGTSVLRFISFAGQQGSVENESTAQVQEHVRLVQRVLDVCTDPERILAQCRQTNAAEGTTSNMPLLVLESSRTLGIIGLTLLGRVGMVNDIMQGFVSIYQRLLASNMCWSLHTQTMTSLYGMFKSIQRDQGQILVTCIPERHRKGQASLLQCRIKGKVYRYDKHNNAGEHVNRKDKDALSKLCFHSLDALIPRSSPIATKLPSQQGREVSLSIATGSYFLTMPTQGGREAIVIFPPTESSLQDIQYMLGSSATQDETMPAVQQLQRIMSSRDGCTAILQPAGNLSNDGE
ncbi:expressed unknown protein [Seminavis robusta]|uniref:Uncharacterized protein n=1 Tax=Seminavis robusta TaxID=568900 RepID=A0A9N8DYI5_9STRA|nr:expressed unknown protein [Seminavis robusta]|eukprot:Sro369_g128300.1 n/a (1103) ;mRNA; r:64135-67443